MSSPRVTALINTYNYGRFVEEAIESVLAQDFPASEMEILVVDDGSTDDTRERVAKFGDRVRYLWKPNGGQASAVNLGFAHGRGEIVALLDADDLWLPQKIRRVVETFDRQPVSGMLLHKRWVWNTTEPTTIEDPDLPVLSGEFPPTRVDLLRYGTSSTSGLAFRKSIAGEVFPIPDSMSLLVDAYLQVLLFFLAPVAILNEPLFKYRVHSSNRFHFGGGDAGRVDHRLRAVSALTQETRVWLDAHGFNTRRPELADFMSRFDLIEQQNRFQAKGAGRLEFFHHLQLHRRIYGPLWTRRYRAYRWLMSYVGLLLGYRGFAKLRSRHGQGGASLHLRRHLLPAETAESLSS